MASQHKIEPRSAHHAVELHGAEMAQFRLEHEACAIARRLGGGAAASKEETQRLDRRAGHQRHGQDLPFAGRLILAEAPQLREILAELCPQSILSGGAQRTTHRVAGPFPAIERADEEEERAGERRRGVGRERAAQLLGEQRRLLVEHHEGLIERPKTARRRWREIDRLGRRGRAEPLENNSRPRRQGEAPVEREQAKRTVDHGIARGADEDRAGKPRANGAGGGCDNSQEQPGSDRLGIVALGRRDDRRRDRRSEIELQRGMGFLRLRLADRQQRQGRRSSGLQTKLDPRSGRERLRHLDRERAIGAAQQQRSLGAALDHRRREVRRQR